MTMTLFRKLQYALLLMIILISCSNEIKDKDFSDVKTVKVGDKTWMAENLSVSKFRNGDPIPEVQNDADWKKAGEEGNPAWCFYNNDPANNEKFGRLYNWYAVTDSRGIAPEGWHVPTDPEWTQLTEQLGAKAGMAMKSKAWAGGQGTNESGMEVFPGGNRNHDGSFHLAGNYAVWWSATASQGNFAWFRFVTSANGFASRDYSNKAKGLSVRLVKD